MLYYVILCYIMVAVCYILLYGIELPPRRSGSQRPSGGHVRLRSEGRGETRVAEIT